MKRFQTDYGGFKPWVSTLFSRIFRKSLLARWREKKEEPTIPTKVSVGQAVTFFKCKGWEGGGLIGPEETVSLLRATIIGGGGTRLLGTPPPSIFHFSNFPRDTISFIEIRSRCDPPIDFDLRHREKWTRDREAPWQKITYLTTLIGFATSFPV